MSCHRGRRSSNVRIFGSVRAGGPERSRAVPSGPEWPQSTPEHPRAGTCHDLAQRILPLKEKETRRPAAPSGECSCYCSLGSHGHPMPPGESVVSSPPERAERHLFDSGEDIKIPIPCPLRFPLGTLVEVHAGKAGWLTARVTRQFYRPHSADWPAGQHSAYELRLDRGGYMHSPCDVGPSEGIQLCRRRCRRTSSASCHGHPTIPTARRLCMTSLSTPTSGA